MAGTRGTLYLIATPIGNLEDVTVRALAVLPKLDVLFCEDTRVTKRLLDRYQLRVPLESYREQVHGRQLERIVSLLDEGRQIGLVSDAGTPGVSDPGYRLVRDLLTERPDAQIVPLPGPSAAITALSASGLPTDEFVFLGFAPHKGRQNFWKRALAELRTVIVYESTHRIAKALAEIGELAPTRQLAVARELTKMFETFYRGPAAAVAESIRQTSDKGEFVILIAPA